MRKLVGRLDHRVIELFQLPLESDVPIFLGDSNVEHMKQEHPEDYEKYGDKLEQIIRNPDFVAKHPRKNSIEYIKVFEPDHVLVAVRVSNNGKLYARTLFVMGPEKVSKYTENKYMKELNLQSQ